MKTTTTTEERIDALVKAGVAYLNLPANTGREFSVGVTSQWDAVKKVSVYSRPSGEGGWLQASSWNGYWLIQAMKHGVKGATAQDIGAALVRLDATGDETGRYCFKSGDILDNGCTRNIAHYHLPKLKPTSG